MKDNKSRIIRVEEKVNSSINHNVNPPRPETTAHYWFMKEQRRRQTQNNINIGHFTI